MARPPLQISPMMRTRVSVAAAAGMSHDEIAMALHISRATLEKHFKIELTTGASERKLEIVNALYRAATNGNVSAAKAYAALTAQAAVQAAARAPVERQRVIGKKLQAQADAVSAQKGSDWNDLLPGPKALQ